MTDPSASVIITNHNYARYLRASIDSALGQQIGGADVTVEVIVVDDGSTDESRAVIESYGRRIGAIFQPNGGQASAFNAGFRKSVGEVVIFLDADDLLLPGAVERILAALRDHPRAVKVHWPMYIIDRGGKRTGQMMPTCSLPPEGDLRGEVIAHGPWVCAVPPTSGNAWRRSMLRRATPIPEHQYRMCADAHLLVAAAILGPVVRIDRPLSCYRVHGENHYWDKSFEETLANSTAVYDEQCRSASAILRQLELPHDAAAWRKLSWWHRLGRAVDRISEHVPPGEAFILIDDDQWGTPAQFRGRRRIPFPEDAGSYAGPPADDGAALEHLRRQFDAGARFVVVGWPSFWYVDEYPRLSEALRSAARSLICNDDVMIFQLDKRP